MMQGSKVTIGAMCAPLAGSKVQIGAMCSPLAPPKAK